jgi:uncharacterized protein YjiS (DUF1127 family)
MLLMTIATKSLSSVPAGIVRVATAGIQLPFSLVRALIHRREVMRLAEIDERGLKDIGLVRSDIAGALATSWLKDPSAVLASRSRSLADIAEARREHAVRHAGAQAAAETPMLAQKADFVVARCA